MGLYGDPDELDRIAGRIEVHAQAVRDQASDYRRDAQNARWVSASADAYRSLVSQDTARAHQVADTLSHAAAVLHEHAQQLRETLALIARIEREAAEWFGNQLKHLAQAAEGFVEDVVDGVTSLVKKVAPDPPWATWPFGPDTLPPTGDKRWLEVGTFLRGQGVLR